MCSKTVLSLITKKITHEVKDKFGEKLDKLILYGSYARGDYDEESDIDIMVLANIPAEDASRIDMELTSLTNKLGLEYDILISLYLKDCETFYKFLPAEPFYQNVLRDGVLLSA